MARDLFQEAGIASGANKQGRDLFEEAGLVDLAENTDAEPSKIRQVISGIGASFGEGAGALSSGVGEFVQAPAANTLAAVSGARALLARKVKDWTGYQSDGYDDIQKTSQQTSAFARDQRAENVTEGGVAATIGKAVEEAGRSAKQYWGDAKQIHAPEMVRQQKKIQDAEGFFDTFGALITNPIGTSGIVSRSMPDMLVGAGVGAIAAKGTAAAMAARGIGKEAIEAGMTRAAGSVGLTAEAASSAMHTKQDVADFVMQQKPEKLAEGSARFRELLQAHAPDQAKAFLAEELANQAALPAGIWTGAMNKLTGSAEAMGKTVATGKTTGREFFKGTAKEGVEEGTQSPGEEYSGHLAKIQADPNQKFDLGKSVAEGLVTGAGMGAGMHGAGYVGGKITDRGATPQPSASPPDPASRGIDAGTVIGTQDKGGGQPATTLEAIDAQINATDPTDISTLDDLLTRRDQITAELTNDVAEVDKGASDALQTDGNKLPLEALNQELIDLYAAEQADQREQLDALNTAMADRVLSVDELKQRRALENSLNGQQTVPEDLPKADPAIIERRAQIYYEAGNAKIDAGQKEEGLHMMAQGDAILRGEQPKPYQPATPTVESGAPGADVQPSVPKVSRDEMSQKANADTESITKSSGHIGFVPATPESPVVQELVARKDGKIGIAEVGKAIDGETGNRFTRSLMNDTPENRARLVAELGAKVGADATAAAVPEAQSDADLPPAVEVRTTPRKRPASDSLIQAIINRGGISREIMSDVGGDPAGRYQPMLFTSNGTSDLSELAGLLFDEDGFHQISQTSDIGPSRELEDLIRRAIGGERILNTDAMEREYQAEIKERHKQDVLRLADEYGVERSKNPRDIDKLDSKVAAAIMAEISKAGDVASDTRIKALDVGMTEDEVSAIEDAIASEDEFNGPNLPRDYMVKMWRKITKALKEKINDRERGAAQNASAVENQDVATAGDEAGRENDGAEGRETGRVEQGSSSRPSLALEGQTTEEAAADYAATQAPEPEVTKDQADKERDTVPFSLAQQSQPKPTGTQSDLLTPDGRATVAAQSNPDAADQKLDTDFRLNPVAIINALTLRGQLKDLHKQAGVRGADAFDNLPMDDKAAAYVKLVKSGIAPVKIEGDYNARVAKEEHDIEVRRMQSENTIRRSDGKPFKSKSAAQKMQAEFDLTDTHAINEVEGGFVLKRLGEANRPSALKAMEERRKADPAVQRQEAAFARAELIGDAAKSAVDSYENGDSTIEEFEAALDVAEKVGASGTAKTKNTEDSGEELSYNLRNRRTSGLKWDEIKGQEAALRVKEVTKAKVYPKPDYAALAGNDQLGSNVIAHIIKQVYDAIAPAPATGRTAPTDEQLQQYIEAVNRVMEGAIAWAKDAVFVSTYRVSANGKPLLDAIYPGGWRDSRAEAILLGGNKFLSALQPGYDEIKRAEKDIGKGWPAKREAWQTQGFKVIETAESVQVRPTNVDGKYYLSIDGHYSQAYPNEAEAHAALDAMQPWLLLNKNGRLVSQHASGEAATEAAREATKRGGKEDGVSDKGIKVTAAQRTGTTHRAEGENITSDRLLGEFGFKGVNFGTWMKGKGNETERQLHLNHAYDSFMDLAEILGVPPKAMSLNGMLGIAFGAQGRAGAAAHFVPGVNEINLTRESGAGSLGHEFAHALDHYFARLGGMDRQTEPFLTEHTGKAAQGELRPEVMEKFKAVVNAMNKRPMTQEEHEKQEADYTKRLKYNVDSWLKSIRRGFESATIPKTTQADSVIRREKTLAKFDEISERIRNLNVGDGLIRLSATKGVYPAVAELRELHKEVFGRAMSLDDSMALQSNVQSMKYQESRLSGEKSHESQATTTDYARNAAKLDKDKGGKPYWNTNLEKFARAFDAFLTDTLAAKAAKNSYLSHTGRTGETVPEGAERETINSAFRDLVDAIDTKQTERGVAMFNANSGARGNPIDTATLDGVIARVIAASPSHFARETVVGHPLFADLPLAIREQAKAEGYDDHGRRPDGYKIPGITYDGKVYIVQENISSEVEAEETLLHERIHQILNGNAKDPNGLALRKSLNALYFVMDGRKGIEALAKTAGADISGPLAALPAVGVNNRHAFLAEEFLAHADGRRAYEKLPAKVKRAVREWWGQFRDWLRSNGFARMADAVGADLQNFTQADLAWTLKNIRSKEAQAGNKAIRFMTAWHGSPHDHDGFDSSKIGTGEGAQAYGWGHYFAGARDVAEWYKNKLSGLEVVVDGERLNQVFPATSTPEDAALSYARGRLLDALKYETDLSAENVASKAEKLAVESERDAGISTEADRLAAKAKQWGKLGGVMNDPAAIARESQIAAALRDIASKAKEGRVEVKKGRLYQVELAPEPDEYLDWDKPLSEQAKPDLLRDIAEQEGMPVNYRRKALHEGRTGDDFYKALSAVLGSDEAASKVLNSYGIRGIKYLDGSSRNRPLKDIKAEFLAELPEDADTDEVMELVGTGRFSPKNEALIKALADDDWLGFDYPAQAISAALGSSLSNYDASPALLQAVSDAKYGGTHNYVIFSDADVSITTKLSRDTSNIDTATRRMDKFVAEAEAGQLKDTDTQILGSTPTVLQAIGAENLPILIDGETVNKVVHNKHRYFVTPEMLRALPSHLYDPLAVFDSPDPRTGAPGKLILTEAADPINGEPIIIAVHLGKQQGRYVVNDISSIYAANKSTQQRKLTPEAIEYYRNEKSLEQSTTPSLDISLRDVVQSAQDSGKTLLTEEDVVNQFGTGFSRGTGIGMALRDLQAVVDRIAKGFKNLPRVHVLSSPSDLSTKDPAQKALRDFIRQSDAWGDVEGATHNGEIYLFASGMADEARAEHVFATHEVTHYGLRGTMGKELDSALQHIYLFNGKVRVAADKMKKARGLKSNVEAVEEVLADIPSADLAKLRGWRKVVQVVRNWLNKAGAKNLAARLDAWMKAGLTDQEKADLFVADLVGAARKWVKSGKNVSSGIMGGTRLADPRLADDLAAQEKWLEREAKMRGFQSIDELAEKDYPAFENLAALWRKKNPVEHAMLSRAVSPAPTSSQQQSVSVNPWQKLNAKVAGILTPERYDKLLYEFQDKLIDLRRLRDHIKEIGGVINDLNDAYLGEEMYHKRVAKRTQDFLEKELKPLLSDMRARAIGLDELETFLHARHAPEANAAMAKRNPNQAEINAGRKQAADEVKALELQLQKAQAQGTATKSIEQALNDARGKLSAWNGAQAFQGTEAERLSLSGMSDTEAKAFMDGLPPAKRTHLDALSVKVDAINASTLDALEKYGLMDKATLDLWRNEYQHYVPLHRDEAHPDSTSHPIGQGFSVKGDASKRRTGSNAKVTHILGHIAMQREAALTRGEKNHVMRRLYLMAKQNPMPEIWTTDKVPTTETVDKKTGFVQTTIDPLYKNRPNVLMLRIAGKDVGIVMNENNPQAVRMAQALKNLDVDDLHYLIPFVGKFTRYFASINTQYNPIFGVINFVRDVQGAALNLSTTALAGSEKEVMKDTLAILGQAIKNGLRMPKTGKIGALWEELQNVGGTTGYRDLYLTPEDRAESLLKELKVLDRGKAMKAAQAVGEWLSDYNEAMENAVRLAAYQAALDKGMSKERAASLAKNLTVNFNRKGRQTREIGALYAFFNAAIQGTARMVETLSGPKGKQIMSGGVLVGALSALAGIIAMGGEGDDDEYSKIPDFVRERSLIIPIGEKRYIAIPMPLGFHFLPNIGRLAVEMFHYRDKTIGSQIGSMFSVVAEAFNPLGGSAPIEQIAAPTVADPFIALLANKDWTGKPIYLENFNKLDPEPGHKRTKDTATAWSKAFAEAINSITGGTQYTPGAWSPTPDQLDFIIGQLTGGVGREIGKVAQSGQSLATGDELPPHKIPLLGRLYGNTDGVSGQSGKFYENIKLANEAENEIKGRMKDGLPIDDYLKKNPVALELTMQGNFAEGQVRQLREIGKRPGITKDEKREVNEKIAAVMKGFNHEVAKTRAQAR